MTAVTPKKYTKDSLIATTPHAEVYKGRYDDNREVAVKRVRLTSENFDLTELINLVNVADHKNVVRYFYSKEEEGFCDIIVELCDTDLEKYIINKQSKDLEKILYGAAKGLEHIHGEHIIHRDLKPSNILLTMRGSEWIAKICDFGIAKELPPGQTSHTGTNQGTKAYMAPELFSSGGNSNERDGEPRFSWHTDVYSFGLVVFFVFSKGKHLCGNWTNIKKGDLVNLNKITDVPTAESLVRWTTADDPRDRPKIAEVLCHPLFWDKRKTLNFIRAVSGAFEDKSYEDLKKIIDEDAHDIICTSSTTCTKSQSEPNPTACADWTTTTKSKSSTVWDDIKPWVKKSSQESFCCLIRIIRNKDTHWNQLSHEVRSEYGGTREAFHDYWMSQFPSLAVYLWDKLELTYLTAVLDPYYLSSSVRRGRFEEAFLTGAKDGNCTETEERIKKGVNLNCRTSEPYNWTSLYIASQEGHAEVVELLLDRGADINCKQNYNWTPLYIASVKGHAKVVKLLLGGRADVNCKDTTNKTPLHIASQNGHAKVVELLLVGGADIDCKEKDNWTPLHLASHNGHAEVVNLLLDRGADRDAETKNNSNALQLALQNGHTKVIELLQNLNADS